MSTRIDPLRLSREDKLLFKQAARAEGMTLAGWLRKAGRDRSKQVKERSWACVDYPDWELSKAAENAKQHVAKKLKRQL